MVKRFTEIEKIRIFSGKIVKIALIVRKKKKKD
jgi:hypothetical protein